MREHPIIFNGDMVRAILAGTKTQTRRPVKPQPIMNGTESFGPSWSWNVGGRKWFSGVTEQQMRAPYGFARSCPYGQPGDRLWVREPGRIVNLAYSDESVPLLTIEYLADKARRVVALPDRLGVEDLGHDPSWLKVGRGIPNGIFREAARLFLEIVSVRVERLDDISIADAQAEGSSGHGAIIPFIQTWERIYGNRNLGCDVNPWLWVIEFKRVEASA